MSIVAKIISNLRKTISNVIENMLLIIFAPLDSQIFNSLQKGIFREIFRPQTGIFTSGKRPQICPSR